MAFQSVSLAKISAVFATIRAKAMSVAPNRLTSLPSQQVSAPIRSRKQSRLSQSAISHSMVTISIAALVAKTCGLPEGSISADSRLDALGVDSLMMLELQSELIKSGIQADMAAMAKCETVKDMECVCGSTPMDLSPSSSTGTESGAFSNATKPMTPYTPTEPLICKSEVLLAIADTCGADADAILSDSALQSLGIDSLMMLELHVKLEKIANGRTCSMNELSDCATVGDIERLVCN
jgi:acyl carrier protein